MADSHWLQATADTCGRTEPEQGLYPQPSLTVRAGTLGARSRVVKTFQTAVHLSFVKFEKARRATSRW
ncbi:MAG: hypothetical protein NTZ54_01510 [Alphaproteobacteria bacterium]|nr:hypothetical protein [Alphaproteobacteria bacterium]